MTISTHEAKTHLSRYLSEVEKGASVIIARGKKPVAMLVPIPTQLARPRPKVGEIEGEPFHFPVEALAAFSQEELKAWGL